MTTLLKKVKKVLNSNTALREEAIETCKKNEIPLTEDNILNVLEMIKFRKERSNLI